MGITVSYTPLQKNSMYSISLQFQLLENWMIHLANVQDRKLAGKSIRLDIPENW